MTLSQYLYPQFDRAPDDAGGPTGDGVVGTLGGGDSVDVEKPDPADAPKDVPDDEPDDDLEPDDLEPDAEDEPDEDEPDSKDQDKDDTDEKPVKKSDVVHKHTTEDGEQIDFSGDDLDAIIAHMGQLKERAEAAEAKLKGEPKDEPKPKEAEEPFADWDNLSPDERTDLLRKQGQEVQAARKADAEQKKQAEATVEQQQQQQQTYAALLDLASTRDEAKQFEFLSEHNGASGARRFGLAATALALGLKQYAADTPLPVVARDGAKQLHAICEEYRKNWAKGKVRLKGKPKQPGSGGGGAPEKQAKYDYEWSSQEKAQWIAQRAQLRKAREASKT